MALFANLNPILIIIDTTHGQIGGTELNSLYFAKTLKQRGMEPLIVEVGSKVLDKYPHTEELLFNTIEVSHFEDVSYSQWQSLIKRTNPLAIFRSKTWIGCTNWKLDLAAFKSRASYLSWEHHPSSCNSLKASVLFRAGNHLTKVKVKLKTWFRTQVHMKTVVRTLAVSQAVKTPLVKYYPVEESKVDVIHPGVDFEFFTHSDESRYKMRSKWNIPVSAFVIGSLGRLVPHKKNDFILKVFAELLKIHPDIWCVIAGKGPDLQRLQTIASELGIAYRVVFPGWQESAPEAWSAIDLFLMPSVDEGLGMTLIESVACGCLVLGAEIGGMTEILDGPLIWNRVPAANLDLWIFKASEIIQSNKKKELQDLAYRHLHQKFDAKIQFNRMVDWLDKHTKSGLKPL